MTPLLVLLAACGGLGLDPQAGPDSGVSDAALRIDDVDPAWGPTTGGTDVVITGAGFQGDVQVWFGSAELEVTVLGDDELLVSTPSTSVEVSVDVKVHSDLGEVTLADGYTYSDSGPPPDGGSEDGGSSDGGGGGGANAGLTRGKVEFTYEVIACPSCFGVTEQLNVGAEAIFHPPVSGSWLDWLPPIGTCTQTAQPSGPTTATMDVGDWVYLSTGTLSHGLRRGTMGDGRIVYSVTGLAQGDWTRYADWDLSAADGGKLGPFEQDGVLSTTYGFDSVEPVTVLNDGAQAFRATFNRNAARLSWSPTSVAESVVAILDVYNAQGTSYLGRVACQVEDSGSVTWPSTMLSGYPSGALLAVFVYRYQTTETTLDTDASIIEGISVVGFAGTGVLQ